MNPRTQNLKEQSRISSKDSKKSLKKDTKKHDSEFKEKEHKENKFLSDVPENTDIRVMGTTKQSRKYRRKAAGNNKNNPGFGNKFSKEIQA